MWFRRFGSDHRIGRALLHAAPLNIHTLTEELSKYGIMKQIHEYVLSNSLREIRRSSETKLREWEGG